MNERCRELTRQIVSVRWDHRYGLGSRHLDNFLLRFAQPERKDLYMDHKYQ